MYTINNCFLFFFLFRFQGLLQIIKDHHESMFELKQQANGGNGGVREVVVGWFCTGSEMTELTCAVHGWFKQFSSVSKFFPQPPLTEPIHLMVDAIMESGSFAVKVRVFLFFQHLRKYKECFTHIFFWD